MNFGALSRGFGTCCLRFKNRVATIPAKLASGWLARLYREGVEPSGSLQKVSDHISRPPFLDLSWRKGSFILNPPSAASSFGHLVGAGRPPSAEQSFWNGPVLSFVFSSRRRHTSSLRDWSSDVCSSDLQPAPIFRHGTVNVPLIQSLGPRL